MKDQGVRMGAEGPLHVRQILYTVYLQLLLLLTFIYTGNPIETRGLFLKSDLFQTNTIQKDNN